MEEIWRDVKEYEGYYQVSNRGIVKSLNYNHTGKEGIMKAQDNGDGYLYVNLWKEGKMKSCTIHRLVAIAFLPNPNNLPEVNHISEDKSDNRVENLEWCSRLYNNTYNDRAKKAGKKQRNDPNKSKAVVGIHKINGLILEFPSAMEASRQTGIDQGNITRCCNGRYKSAGGFYWYYVDSEEVANEQE